jgi:hypothetical protein
MLRWILNLVVLTMAIVSCVAQTQLSTSEGPLDLVVSNESPEALYRIVCDYFSFKVEFDKQMRSDKKVDLRLNNASAKEALDTIAILTGTSWQPVTADSIYVTDGMPSAAALPRVIDQNSPPAPATPPSRAPLPAGRDGWKFRRLTLDFGGGWTRTQGGGLSTGINFRGGVGWRLSPQPHRYDDIGNALRARHWSVYVVGEFAFTDAGLTKAGLQQQIQLNSSLSSATSATARYYTGTADPTFRYCVLNCRVTFYGLGGFGWMRRTVEFDGPPTATSPVGSNAKIASFDYHSPAYEAGSGVTFGPFRPTEGITYYVEWRRLQGFGSNGGSTLWPISFGVRW